MRALGPGYTQPEPFQWSRDNRDFQPYGQAEPQTTKKPRVFNQPSPQHPLPQWGMKPTVFRGANHWPHLRYNAL
jgi:hypothetical protein